MFQKKKKTIDLTSEDIDLLKKVNNALEILNGQISNNSEHRKFKLQKFYICFAIGRYLNDQACHITGDSIGYDKLEQKYHDIAVKYLEKGWYRVLTKTKGLWKQIPKVYRQELLRLLAISYRDGTKHNFKLARGVLKTALQEGKEDSLATELTIPKSDDRNIQLVLSTLVNYNLQCSKNLEQEYTGVLSNMEIQIPLGDFTLADWDANQAQAVIYQTLACTYKMHFLYDVNKRMSRIEKGIKYAKQGLVIANILKPIICQLHIQIFDCLYILFDTYFHGLEGQILNRVAAMCKTVMSSLDFFKNNAQLQKEIPEAGKKAFLLIGIVLEKVKK